MGLEEDLAVTTEFGAPEDLAAFQRHMDPEWIDMALNATGKATLRRRRLPAEQVMWLVLGIGLYRDRSIADVAAKLDIALSSSEQDRVTVAPSALAQARARLGDEPLKWLFSHTGSKWAHEHAKEELWQGLSLYGVDGVILRTPDTEENRDYFGTSNNQKNKDAAYPQVKMVTLMALRSHLLAAASFGPYKPSEVTYAKKLWDRVPDDSITLLDKGFYSSDILISLSEKGHNRHWLIPARKDLKWTVIKKYSKDDVLVEMNVSYEARKKNPSLPKKWRARMITYQCKGFEPRQMFTSLDAEKYSAEDIARLYHERWEIELGYGEIKTDILHNELTLRSQKKEGIIQEIYGLLIAYNLVRLEITQIAKEANIAAIRISFVTALRFIKDEFLWCSIASPGAVPKHLRRLRADIKRFVLPERKSERRYPRVVKTTKTRYPIMQRGAIKCA